VCEKPRKEKGLKPEKIYTSANLVSTVKSLSEKRLTFDRLKFEQLSGKIDMKKLEEKEGMY
jgi:hypothetical protein